MQFYFEFGGEEGLYLAIIVIYPPRKSPRKSLLWRFYIDSPQADTLDIQLHIKMNANSLLLFFFDFTKPSNFEFLVQVCNSNSNITPARVAIETSLIDSHTKQVHFKLNTASEVYRK